HLTPLPSQSLTTHPHLHSFPTRRSSDLQKLAADDLQLRLENRTEMLRGGHAEGLDGRRRRPERRERGHAQVLDPTRDNVPEGGQDRKSTRLNSSHQIISYAVFCLKKKSK